MPASAVNRWVRKRWVIVADESAAEIYSQLGKTGPLESEAVLRNAVARQRPRELGADRAGRSFDSRGRGRHALAKEVDPREQAAQRFAHEVAHFVAEGLSRKKAHSYILIAAPRFLGQLRTELRKLPLPAPSTTIDKDVVGQSAATVASVIDRYRR